MSFNKIKQITKDTFLGLSSNLRTLYLNSCELRKIEPGGLTTHLTGLRSLDLSYNSLDLRECKEEIGPLVKLHLDRSENWTVQMRLQRQQWRNKHKILSRR